MREAYRLGFEVLRQLGAGRPEEEEGWQYFGDHSGRCGVLQLGIQSLFLTWVWWRMI